MAILDPSLLTLDSSRHCRVDPSLLTLDSSRHCRVDSSLLTLDSSRHCRVDSSPLTLDPSRLSEITKLCGELKFSLRRPGSRTLRLLERALNLLSPFESPKAAVTSASERRDLLTLLSTHRDLLCPYINTDRIETNLRYCNPL